MNKQTFTPSEVEEVDKVLDYHRTQTEKRKVGLMNAPPMPWVDYRLSEEAMNHLSNAIDNQPPEAVTHHHLAGNISRSVFIKDKNTWLYENVLKEMSEYMYYKDWNNWFEVNVANSRPPTKFYLKELWINYQKQHEFNPSHIHSGGYGYSFVIFIKIPTHWKEQHALPLSANSNVPSASDFQFIMGQGQGPASNYNIFLSPEDEGRILFFPAWLMHQVYPFYGTEEERITISGNIVPEEDEMPPREEREKALEHLQKQVDSIKDMIKKDAEET